jgi:hypothetical protein
MGTRRQENLARSQQHARMLALRYVELATATAYTMTGAARALERARALHEAIQRGTPRRQPGS